MFKDINQFYQNTVESLNELNSFVEEYGLVGEVKADHLCYKCTSSESFESIRKMFEDQSSWIYQSIISQRRIAVIRFLTALESQIGQIDLLELSDQKPDKSQKDGFDHIEIYPISMSYEDLVLKLKNQSLEVNEIVRPHHTTHDIKLDSGFIIRLTRKPLADKIKQEEML